ncbi:hypothetical protein tb265_00220 [Gemmatimonadetes bacterium T265]|nr:hypothetical protein tb265_00220 [Gemmatimonadetes bacterium T265]
MFQGRGAVLDDIARHLREDLIARAGAAEAADDRTVAVPLLAVRLLVQVLMAYGPPAHLLLAMLDVAAVDTYRQHRSARRAYAWHVAPDVMPAMQAAMRLQPATWVVEPLVSARTHLFGSPVRLDPTLAPGAIYLRPDGWGDAPDGAACTKR